jgi:hypothetical protein
MKILTALFIVLINFSFSQEIKYHNPNFDFENGKKYFLFGNDVKFRKLPELASETIDLLKIGTEIEIIEKTESTLNYNGIKSPFYKVKHKNNIGYILGGLISLEKKEINSSKYFFSYEKDKETYSILIRHLNLNSEFIESKSILSTNEFLIDIYNHKGIEDIDHILFINYLAEACGVDGGGIFFFKTKSELIKVLEISQVSDAGVYWVEEKLIFPNDKNGVKGKIVYQKEIGNYEDEDTNWIEIRKTSRELEWKNGVLYPNLDKEK